MGFEEITEVYLTPSYHSLSGAASVEAAAAVDRARDARAGLGGTALGGEAVVAAPPAGAVLRRGLLARRGPLEAALEAGAGAAGLAEGAERGVAAVARGAAG